MPSASKKQHNLMAMVANNPAKAKQLGIKQSVGEEFMKADKGRKFGKGGEAHSEKGEMKKDIAQDKKIIKKAFAMHDKQEHKGEHTNLSKLKKGGMARMAAKGEHSVQKQSKRGAEVVKMRKGGKCYEEGGEIETETTQGQNKNIGDDVRARAMAALEKGISDDTSAAKSITKSAPSLPSRKSFVSKANKAGFAADQTGGGAALMTRKDRKMASGGLTSQAAGMANRPAMPAQSNVGGAMRGLDRAAAMSGRTFSKGGAASKRADGCATKGKTKGKIY